MTPLLLPLFMAMTIIAAAQQPAQIEQLHHSAPTTEEVAVKSDSDSLATDDQQMTAVKNVKEKNRFGIYFEEPGMETDTSFNDAYFSIANMFLMMEEYEKAAEYFTQIIEVNPYYMGAYTGLAEAYFKRGLAPKAVATCEKALEMNSSYTLAYYKLGEIYLNQHKYEKAAQQFEKAVSLDPYYIAAYEELYLLYKNELEDEEKAAFYKSKLSAAPAPEWTGR